MTKSNFFKAIFRNRKISTSLIAVLLLMVMNANAQIVYVPVSPSTWNNDIVASPDGANFASNTSTTGSMPGVTSPTIGTDGNGPGAFTLVANDYKWWTGGTVATCGLPGSLTFTSVLGAPYQLQPYSGNNVHTITSGTYSGNPYATTGTITLATPASYGKLLVLYESVNNTPSGGSSTLTTTVTFTNSNTQVFTNTLVNWFTTTGKAYTPTLQRAGNAAPGTPSGCSTAGPCIFEMALNILPANYSSQVASISFAYTTAAGTSVNTVNYFHFMSLAGQAPCLTPLFQPTVLTQGTTTTSSISGTFTAASGSPSGYLVVRYPTLSSPTNPVDGTTYSAGQPLGSGTVVQASNSTSFNTSGLTGGTAYDFYVYSYNSGATCSGPIYQTSVTPGDNKNTFATNACGTMNGVIPIGPTAPAAPAGFPTLSGAGGALAYINTNGLGGNTILELQSDYTSAYAAANETYPLTFSSNPCVNSSKTLTIRPAGGVSSVITLTSAHTTLATVVLDGASYITFDGRNGGTGTNKYLSFVNTSTTAAASGNAILLKNDANNNTLTYLDVQSANGNAAANTAVVTAGAIPGAIAIGTTSGTNGNDKNTISFCDVHSTGTNLGVCIYAGNNTAAGNTANNDSTIITDNNIYDFYLATTASAGVDISLGNNNWTITNNHVYQQSTRNYGAGVHAVRGFWITPNTASLASASGFIITGNYIGGNAANGTGTYTMTGTANWVFRGMDISVGLGTATSIQNNTLTNWNITGGFTGNSVYGIDVNAGNVNVGTVTGNVVGSTTANGAITVTTTVTGGSMIGLRSGNASGGTINFSNDTISGIDMIGTATTIATGFNGIAASGGANITVNNNTIGSATLANSINMVSTSTTTATAPAVRGIICNSTVTGVVNNITDNLVANINSNYSAGVVNNTLIGIAVTTGISTISGNTIRNLTTNTLSTGGGATPAVIGIVYTSTATTSALISNNTIHTLKSINTTAVSAIQTAGIWFSGPSSGTHTIEKNFIHSISIASVTNSAGFITGMDLGVVSGATITVKNNMIRLGYDETGASIVSPCTIRGITKNAPNSNIWFNSIFIGGTGVGTTATPSFCIARTANATDNWRNNILVNNRSNATTGGKHYQIYLVPTTAFTLNNNVYYGIGTGSVFGFNGTSDVTAYSPGWASGDLLSQVGNPQFLAPTGSAATVNLHLNPALGGVAESSGIAIAGLNNDIDGDIRQGSGGYAGTGTAPDVGADEYEGSSAIPTINSLVISPTTAQCAAVIHGVTATVTAAGGPITSVSINYSVNGVSQTPVSMTLTSGSVNATSVWEGNIPVPSPANATIAWSVTATDGSFSKIETGVSYSDEPLFGITATASASISSVCSGNPTDLSLILSSAAAAPSTPAPTPVTNPTTDEDLGNVTITLGANTILNNSSARNSLVGTIGTATGTAGSYADYTAFGPYVMIAGQTYNFSLSSLQNITAYNNGFGIYIDYNRNGLFTDAGEFVYVSPALVAGAHTRTGSFTVPAAASLGRLRMRVISKETSLVASPTSGVIYGEFEDYMLDIKGTSGITAYSWNDGSGVVGTTNPLTVSPTGNTTYTVTATHTSGCPIITSTSVVSNALPTQPTASVPSSQCGYGVPTASVTSTSGAGTPVFNWYSALTGGTLLQTGTSATFTGAINSSTTFYITEIAGVCESSPRIQVVANVTYTDAISIVTNNQSCVGTANPFSVTQAGANQTYTTYTWSAAPVSGSGVSGSPTGATQTFTASSNGNYSYVVIATDGICTVVDTQLVSIYTGLTGNATATQITSCVNPTGLITANVSGAGTVVNNDFTSTVLPSYISIPATVNGVTNNAAITGGRLQLTPGAVSQNGGVLISNTTGLANSDFQVDFDFITTTSGGVGPADGLSYSYGDDVVAFPNSSGVGPAGAAPENGSGSKLKLSFDAINNTTSCPAGNVAGVYLMYNSIIPHQGITSSTPCPGVLYYTPDVTWRANSTPNLTLTTHVTIKINALAQVSMWLNNVQVVNNIQLPASYLTADKSTWKHAFSSRTGAGFEGHYIDNLLIQYNNFYEYSIDSGSTWSQTNPIIPPTSGTYSVDARYVTVPGCFANLGTVTINAPSFTTNSTLTTICGGTTTMPTLSFSPSFGTGAAYQWQSSPAGAGTWTNVAGATATTYVPGVGTIATSTDFRCEISCAGIPIPGSPSSTFTVNVNPAPAISVSPTTSSVCSPGGTPVALTASGDPATYAWTPTTGLSTSTGASVNALPAATTTYTVIATATSGCTSSATTTVTAIASPNVTVTATPNAVCPGGNIQLNATVSTGGPFTYDWSLNNTYLSATNIANPIAQNIGSTQTYSVIVSATSGCSTTKTINAVVNNSPQPLASSNAPLCAGFTLTLFGDNLASGQVSGNTWSWSGPSFTSSSQNPTISGATSSNAGTYTLTVTNSNGCTASSSHVIAVNPNPVISVTSQTNASCPGSMDGCIDIDANNGTPLYLFDLDGNATLDGNYCGLGAGTYTANVIDDNGCEAATSFITLTDLDVTPPTISCPANISAFATSASGAVITYSVTGNDNCGSFTTAMITGLASGSTFPIGITTVTYEVTDDASLTAQCSFTVEIVGLPPQIVCPSNITVNNVTGLCEAPVSYLATETVGIPASTITYDIAPGSSFPVGTTTVTATATNAVGSSVCTFDVTVIDNEEPTIICPVDVTVNNTPGLCTGIATWTAPSGTDNCPGSVTTLTGGMASGSAFPVGITPVTYTVTDASNNAVTCTFNVTVIDNQNPSIACPPDVIVNANNGFCYATGVALGSPTNGDNCGVLGITNNAPAQFPVGATIVDWEVEDLAGNKAGCQQIVIVVDNQFPTISGMPSNITFTADPTDCYPAITWTAPTAADNCSVASFTSDHASGDEFPEGTTTVTYTAIDINGNQTQASFTVTILTQPLAVGISSPVFACGYNISCNGNNNGQAAATVGGGCLPYTLLWSNGATTYGNGSLTAGTYTLTVTDDNGHVTIQTVTLTEPPALVTTLGPDQSYEFECTCADLVSSTTGGSTCSPYVYAWSTGASTSSINVCPTQSATYSVTVTDINGCVTTDVIQVIKPAVVAQLDRYVLMGTGTGNVSVGNSCSFSNGSVGKRLAAGTLSIGNNTFCNISVAGNNVVVGNNVIISTLYRNTATIGAGAVISSTVTPVAMPLTAKVPCFPVYSGGANVNVPNNTTVVLSPGTYNNVTLGNNSILKLNAGVYNVNSISTFNGSFILPNGTATAKDIMVFVKTSMNVSNNNEIHGSYYAQGAMDLANGNNTTGTFYGAYLGNPVSVGNNLSFFLDAYCYSDLALCTVKMDGDEASIAEPGTFNLFPNPNNGMFTIQYAGQTGNEINMSVLNTLGQVVYQRDVHEFTGEITQEINLNTLAPGVYFIQVRNGNEFSRKQFIITK